MLLQVLRTLETLAAEVALVGFERHVDSDMGSNVVTFHSGRAAEIPAAGQVQVICALTADMTLADVLLFTPINSCTRKEGSRAGQTDIERLGRVAALGALLPLTGEVVVVVGSILSGCFNHRVDSWR